MALQELIVRGDGDPVGRRQENKLLEDWLLSLMSILVMGF
jgi:hypothetical protein